MSLQEQEDDENGASEGLDQEEEEAILACKRVYDPEEGSVNFRWKRVTELANCKRITVPNAAEASKEAKIQVLVNNLEDAISRNRRKEASFL